MEPEQRSLARPHTPTGDGRAPVAPGRPRRAPLHGAASSRLLLSNHVHAGSINGVPTVCQADWVGTVHLWVHPTLWSQGARFPRSGSE